MSKRSLYLECYSGISGDMTVASLLDLGADEEVLRKSLDSLKVEGYKINISRTFKNGIDACDFDVILEDEEDYHIEHTHEHDHDHHEHDHHDHDHHEHDHHHGHIHDHHHVHNDHDHRNINDIYKIINDSEISEKAKSISKKIFDVVAIAESTSHGVDVADVHFHEVGAIDSIVDIVSTAVLIDNLDIDEVIVSELYEGIGHVKCQHGIIPVPVPAVVNIVSEHSLSLRLTDNLGEMITPTGAAIAAALKTKDKLPLSYRITKIGIGAGKKNFTKANILRAYLIEEEINQEVNQNIDDIWVLETNIDDSTGENLSYTMEKLFEKGATDVYFTSIYMKKNRPAVKLTVLCKEENITDMEYMIFTNTSTIGIRKYKTERSILSREIKRINTKYGEVNVKQCYYDNNKYFYPEYEDIKKICNETGLSYKTVYDEIKKEASEI